MTLTSMMFMRPMAAPRRVIKPMMVAPAVTFCKLSMSMMARLSDLTTSKSSCAPAEMCRILRNKPVASI